MNELENFIVDVLGNIVGNKLTDVDKEKLLQATFQLTLELRERLASIEHKIDRLSK